MKKILYLLLISFSIISCSQKDNLTPKSDEVSNQSKSASKLSTGVNVKLYTAWTSYNAKYGYYLYTRRFQVEDRNLAFDKKVFISHEMIDGSWKDFPMTYVSSTPDNSEIWAADLSATNFGENPSMYFGDEFVARYEVQGNKYWDNNNNQNYKMDVLEGTYLRSDVNVAVDRYYSSLYSYSNYFSIHADVRNIAYSKQVSVIYSTDGWASNHTVALNFAPYLTVGAMQTLNSPNKHGIERWIANLTADSTVKKVEFAVSYKVNGATYWDNNFGKNYTIVRN